MASSSFSTTSLKTPTGLSSLPLELRLKIFKHLAKDTTISISSVRTKVTRQECYHPERDLPYTTPISSENGQYITIVHEKHSDMDSFSPAYDLEGPAKRLLAVSPGFATDVLLAIYEFGTFQMPDPFCNINYLPTPSMASLIQDVAICCSHFRGPARDRALGLLTHFPNIKRLRMSSTQGFDIITYPYGREYEHVQRDVNENKAMIDRWSRGWSGRNRAWQALAPACGDVTQQRMQKGIAALYIARAKEGSPISISWDNERNMVFSHWNDWAGWDFREKVSIFRSPPTYNSTSS